MIYKMYIITEKKPGYLKQESWVRAGAEEEIGEAHGYGYLIR